jgi:hypothetical protein
MVVEHTVKDLVETRDVHRVIVAGKNAQRAHSSLKLWLVPKRVFPLAAAAFSASIDAMRIEGLEITIGLANEISQHCAIDEPQPVSDLQSGHVLSRVFRYDSLAELTTLTSEYLDALIEHHRCADGVIDSLNWSLPEVMDNVFQHSRSEVGFAVMQIHPSTKRCTIGVADAGIGIENSFRRAQMLGGGHAHETIARALRERVTTKPGNMGNGLFGLRRIVELNDGKMTIASGRGVLRFEGESVKGESRDSFPVISDERHGTWVDWQLRLDRSTYLTKALPNASPVVQFDLERRENDQDLVEYEVVEMDEVVTRTGAERVRNRIENTLVRRPEDPVVLNFRGASVVSSSFADEVMGKLALYYGEDFVSKRLKLRGMTPTVKELIARAIEQRIAEGDDVQPGRTALPITFT